MRLSHLFIIGGVCLLVLGVLSIILCWRVGFFWYYWEAAPQYKSNKCYKGPNKKDEVFNGLEGGEKHSLVTYTNVSLAFTEARIKLLWKQSI